MDYFTEGETFSAQWPFVQAGNKLYMHKKTKSLLITNINHNVTVLWRGQFLSPNVTLGSFSEKMKMIPKKKQLPFSQFSLNYENY